MNEKIDVIYQKIKTLESDLEDELEKARETLQYRIEEKRILFEQSVIAYHRELRKTLYQFIREARFLSVVTAPVIYAMIFPLLFIDICVTIYQFICFPVYGIKKVPRSDFIVMDRHHLEYLNFMEKLNCSYCGYASGLATYIREIAARTEKYWCPIKHARKIKNPHSRYSHFAEYGDAKAYRESVENENDN